MMWMLLPLTLSLGLAHGFNTPTCDPGRTVIVHLFNWRWTSIAKECEDWLGPKGFCGVQVSPPNEHILKDGHPWWERYQPVSYQLESVSGNRGEFIDMVNRCGAVGVRIYVDMVVNHMVGAGQTGHGSGGSWFDGNSLDFPGVPFGGTDFNCCGGCSGEGRASCYSGDCSITNYGDRDMVRNCRLVGLTDLALGKEYVRQKIADFFNDLINIGVRGFRVDACKHMWPGDIQAIYNKLVNKNVFIFNEVIDLGGEAIGAGEYTHLGRITEFRYSANIGRIFRGYVALKDLRNFGEGWGMLGDGDALVFVDNHDNQRGHGAGGSDILTYKNAREYKMANAFMMAWAYGFSRMMSSFFFTDTEAGPPFYGDKVAEVIINGQGTCDGGWVCEHRWRQIANMVAFSNAADGHGVYNWWDNGNNQIAFSRGNKAFIAINNDGYPIDQSMQTGLPSGTYCDVISGSYTGSSCTGSEVQVDGNGYAHIYVPNGEDPILAIHENSRLGSGGGSPNPTPGPATPSPTQGPPPAGYQRTVVFLQRQTSVGQDLFLKGGIDGGLRPGCGSSDAAGDPCSIPIQHNDLGSTNHYAAYNAWKVGDNYLDWYTTPERGQGSFNGQSAGGTPLAWTSNQQSSSGYQPLNRYGEHYWMVDFNMDCDSTEQGWFDLKGYLGGQWENDLRQGSCGGSAGGSAPYQSGNHQARCGYVNVFSWGSSDCTIDNF